VPICALLSISFFIENYHEHIDFIREYYFWEIRTQGSAFYLRIPLEIFFFLANYSQISFQQTP